MGTSEHIGVVLVHGIGEQRRFEHLSKETRNLIAVLRTNPDVSIRVEAVATWGSEVLSDNETWHAKDGAPVRIEIRYTNGPNQGKCQSLHIHEVWWADLDNKATLWNNVKFWFWGLGMWGAKRFTRARRPAAKSEMRAPVLPGHTIAHAIVLRVLLFGVATIFLLSAITIDVLSFLGRWLRFIPLGAGSTIYRFMGDIKLYQDRGRDQEGSLTDIGMPPRVAIRRRMVNEQISAFSQEYDRWYVLAHSLGSVIAFNGLMETAHALPNYLGHSDWCNLHSKDILGQRSNESNACVEQMWPARPFWINDDNATIDRRKLFSKLRGLVTYGSPLEKYAYLWPQIVNINKDNTVFADNFEWINIFDHNDPVAEKIHAFSNSFGDGHTTKNYAYRASRILLRSHTRYLSLRRGKVQPDHLTKRLMDWILAGDRTFPSPAEQDRNWYPSTNPNTESFRRFLIWSGLQIVLATVVGLLGIPALLGALDSIAGALLANYGAKLTSTYSALRNQLPGGGLTAALLLVWAVVFLAGILRALVERRMDKRRDALRSRSLRKESLGNRNANS